MAWLSISLHATAGDAEAMADALLEAGALSVSCDDADAGTPREAAQFAEPGESEPHPWRRNVLNALLPADTKPQEIVAAAAQICGIAFPPFETRRIEDEDWVRLNQRQFVPIRITGRLWIVPSWCEPPEPAALNLSIDPGLAFGTGSHPTTRLMLRWLESTLQGGESVLDYGCGSGILAIAAARLGATEVAGVDIDPQAVIAAQVNASKNAVKARFFAVDAYEGAPSDIVVANILPNPLIALEPTIAGLCRGRVALAGILEAQAGEVADAYAGDFEIEAVGHDEGWVLLAGTRK